MASQTETDNQFVNKLLDWYNREGRMFEWRSTNDPYKTLVVEIMLQKTIATNVQNIYPKFLKQFPSIEKLNEAATSKIEKLITPLGIAKRKAESYKRIAARIIENFESQIPTNKKDLKSLYMVGDYVANAVLCFAFNEKAPIIDVNISRIISRVFSLGDKKEVAAKVEHLLPNDHFKEFNWALIDFGALVCRKINPKCEECPLNTDCEYYENNKS